MFALASSNSAYPTKQLINQLAAAPESGAVRVATRAKRDVQSTDSRPSEPFPSIERATSSDATLQKNVSRWLGLGEVAGNIIPSGASIEPALKLYTEAITDPKVQEWFKAQGFKPDTVRIFNDSVTGTVTRDGKDLIKRFSLTDGSGWWAVGAKVRAAQAILSPRNYGIPITQSNPQAPLPYHVILDFYGVHVPRNDRAARQLGSDLKKNGWPAITKQQRSQWRAQYIQASQASGDKDVRARLHKHLLQQLEQAPPGASLGLEKQVMDVGPGALLDQYSVQPREKLLGLLRSPVFVAFLEKAGSSATEENFRVYGRELQYREPQGQWTSLQAEFDEEVRSQPTAENASMKASLDALFDDSKQTGNALYASRTYDVGQILNFYSGGTPRTPPEIKAALGWLNLGVAPSPLGKDYAELTPYREAPGALSEKDTATLAQLSAGVGDLLADAATAPDNWNTLSDDPDYKLETFFDSPAIVALAQTWAEALNFYEVADGSALPRGMRHQLVATAIKLSLGIEVPGTPGKVAGYDIFQPTNAGRSIQAVREDVHAHLISKGVSAASAPLVAHLLLAQAAPEMLIKGDTSIAADAPNVLAQRPGEIKIGSAAWMELCLGCSIADSLSGVGASRMMNSRELMELTRLQPQDEEQSKLFRTLRMKPLLLWATMEGAVPRALDGKYSIQASTAAVKAYSEKQAEISQAFAKLMAEPPTLTSLLVQQLALLFPEMTEEELRDFKVQRVYKSSQHHLPQSVPLTELVLEQQDDSGLLVTLNNIGNDLRSGQSEFKYSHPRVSEQVFKERIKALPKISTLVAPAIDRYITDVRAAHAVTLKLMISQLPAQDRKALENGKVEFFHLRKETGDVVETDSLPNSAVRENTGSYGTLIRFETPGVEPGYACYEVFPKSMRMIKRTDLPKTLALGGVIETEVSPFSTLSTKKKRYRRGKSEAFDFDAYSSGSEPRPGVKSNVIIERAAPSLASKTVLGEADSSDPAPRSFKSKKVADIVERILSNRFDDRREELTAHANRLTPYQVRRAWPFGATDALSPSNLRLVLNLIPFVGAVTELAEGNVAAGVKGLLIDFASFVVTGGLGAASKFYKGFKVILPFGGRAFSLKGLQGGPALFRGLFNPLDGVVDVFKSGAWALGSAKVVTKAKLKFVRGATVVERSRWGLGIYETVDNATPENAGHRLGRSKDVQLYATQKDNQWYAIDPVSQKPTGTPLTDFVLEHESAEPEAR